MLKPIINVPPWAANDPDLKMDSSILLSSLLCSKEALSWKGKRNHRPLVMSLNARVLIFVQEWCCWWQGCGGFCSRKGAGQALCSLLSPLLSPCFPKRFFSSPQTIYPTEVAHSITKITHKMSFLPSVWFQFVFFLSEYRIVSSSELDLCVHWGTALSLLISYGTGKWISHWRGKGFLTKVPSIHLSIFISFTSTSLLLNCCSLMLSDRLIFLVSDFVLSLLKVPWA